MVQPLIISFLFAGFLVKIMLVICSKHLGDPPGASTEYEKLPLDELLLLWTSSAAFQRNPDSRLIIVSG